MARRRVYRHHIRCHDLGSNRMRRDEFSNSQQARRCGDCRPCCVPAGAYRRPGRAVKAQAIAIYIEGSSLSAIGRVLGYSAPAVLGWVKNGQHTLRRLRERSKQRTEGAACDELWTYRGVRREIWWIWAVAAEKDGRRWVDLTVGDRSENTFWRLYDRLPEAAVYHSDRYAVYRRFQQDRHCAGKSGAVNWNEGLHSALRSKRNRPTRRTKGYAKSIEMLVYSLALVCGWR